MPGEWEGERVEEKETLTPNDAGAGEGIQEDGGVDGEEAGGVVCEEQSAGVASGGWSAEHCTTGSTAHCTALHTVCCTERRRQLITAGSHSAR
jgi:hypothetical protein